MAKVTINFLDDAGPVAERPRRTGVYVEDERGIPELRAVIFCAREEPAGWMVRDMQGKPVLSAEVMQELWLDFPTHAAQRRRLRELVLDHFKRSVGERVNSHLVILHRNSLEKRMRRLRLTGPPQRDTM
jgi:hypothetical protein